MASIAGVACGGSDTNSPIVIVEPAHGAVLPSSLVLVRGRVRDASIAEVQVGDEVVPVEAGAFEARVRMTEGPVTLEAEGNGHVARVRFHIDLTAPTFDLETSERFIHGTEVTLRGTVSDPNLKGLFYGDTSITVGEDGSFSETIEVEPGAHRIRLRAEDRAGNASYRAAGFIAGEFRPYGEEIDDSILFNMDELGVESAAEVAQVALERSNLAEKIRKDNPIIEGSFGKAKLESFTYSKSEVEILPGRGNFEFLITLYDIKIRLKLLDSLAKRATLTAEEGELIAIVGLKKREGRIFPVLRASLTELSDFDIDVSGVPSGFTNILKSSIRFTSEQAISDAVAEVMEDFITDLMKFIHDDTLLPVGSSRITLDLNVGDIDLRPDGLFVALQGATTVLNPRDSTLEQPGSVLLPLLEGEEEEVLPDPGVFIAFKLDAINALAATASATRTARTRISFDAISVATLGLLFPVANELAPLDAPIALVIETRTPPVARHVAGEQHARVLVPDISVEVIAVTDSGDQTLATTSISLEAPVEVVVARKRLLFRLGEVDFHVDLEVPLAGVEEGPTLDTLVWDAFGEQIFTYLQDLLDLINFGLPDSYDFQYSQSETRVQQGYVMAEGVLVPTPQ